MAAELLSPLLHAYRRMLEKLLTRKSILILSHALITAELLAPVLHAYRRMLNNMSNAFIHTES